MADMMSEAQHIHNKVIFDCVNEGLNAVRPYGSSGEPMPWSRKPRRNLIFMFESADDLDKILDQVKINVYFIFLKVSNRLSTGPRSKLEPFLLQSPHTLNPTVSLKNVDLKPKTQL